MDSRSSVSGSSTPKHKHLKRQKMNEGEDMISKLPESLVSRILSLLPTKDAVRTSVLSKRWIRLWRSITKLDLDDSVFYSPKKKAGGKQHFVNFVYRALLLTKSSSLDGFTLVIGNNYKYDVSLVNTWISSVLSRSVKKLCIQSQMELPFFSLTSLSLFDCKLLEELVLNMYICAAITVPSNIVCLVRLKLLKLCGIKFTLDSSCYSKDLSLNFPVLQKFEAKNCTWLGAKRVTFKVPLLESVFIEQEAESISSEPNVCPINISASHLTEFTYCGYGYISQHITLIDPPSAHNASANIILRQCEKDKVSQTGLRAFLLLKQFSQLKYLKFEGSEVGFFC